MQLNKSSRVDPNANRMRTSSETKGRGGVAAEGTENRKIVDVQYFLCAD